MTSRECMDLEDRYGADNYRPLDVVLTRGEGVWVWDVDGKKYLDMLAAYSAVNQGHCHPALVSASVEQARRLTLTSRAFRNDRLGPFCRLVAELSGYDKVLPMNTGAEAVETAIKLCRKWGYTVKGIPQDEAEILVFDNNFHGRTTTIVGFSTVEQYRQGFGPYGGGFRSLPFGDADAVAAAMNDRVAAVLVEPIQGEGGINIPRDGYLRELRQLCDRHNALLVADEIQSGLGRTGKLFAVEHEGVRPDVVIVGKALSGGLYPVSAVLADEAIMGVFKPGDHGSTYGGNPLAAAVAEAALRVLVEEGMIDNAARLGEQAMARLRRLASPHVQEIRGRGLWIGIELRPEAGGAGRFCKALVQQGVLCKETHDRVIRIAPPLVIKEEELAWGLERIEAVLTGDAATEAVAASAGAQG